MKLNHIIILGLLVISCSRWSQEKNRDLKVFNNFFGQEKATALNSAVGSFDRFLKANYSDLDNQSKRTKAFLKYLQKNFDPDPTWKLPTKRNQEIISAFETSELRKEIWIYGYEYYKPKHDIHKVLPPDEQDNSKLHNLDKLDLNLIEEEIIPSSNIDSDEIAKQEKEMEERIKNSLHFNSDGQYLYALTKYMVKDTIIQEYMDAKMAGGDFSQVLFASGLLSQQIDFEDPFIKRILVTEFYYWIMKWDIERKKKK